MTISTKTRPSPLAPASFLLPADPRTLSHWAVVACDQFSTDPSYWQAVTDEVGADPSLLHCIIRDTELRSPDLSAKVAAVHAAMDRYRRELRPTERGVMMVERWVRGLARQGLVLTVDLEQYDFRGGPALVRPTERTIEQRLPLRRRIREGASLDVSHIVLLLDDPEQEVFEPLFHALRPLTYHAELMQDGGPIAGMLLANEEELTPLFARLNELASAQPDRPFLIVGDGNHSLAAAKLAWESLKAKGAAADHPARHALVEVVNLHSQAIGVQPIHRLVRGMTGAAFIERALGQLPGSSFEPMHHSLTISALYGRMLKIQDPMLPASAHQLPVKALDVTGVLSVPKPPAKLEIATAQALIEGLGLGEHTDYVHGEEELDRLVAEPYAVGLHLPRLDKARLFESIAADGPLPPKAFSLGEAHEKRYYLETRSLIAT